MTFLEELTAHKGGLIRLKTELWWYGGRGRDGIRGRVCLLMDAAPTGALAWSAANTTPDGAWFAPEVAAGILLLIDGRPHWVWVSADNLELL
jgi:hypothetical protein